jgi:hypothetical protein
MGVRIDKVESDMENAFRNIEDGRENMRTMRTLFNAITIALVAFMLYLFFWLDNKQEAKFIHLLTEIKASNNQVNSRIVEVNSNLTAELVKINQAIHAINHDHDTLRESKR